MGLTTMYDSLPSYIGLFSLFWPISLLREIACETNRYAGSLDSEGRMWGRSGWYPTTWKELRIFLAIMLYMRMKRLPNMKAY